MRGDDVAALQSRLTEMGFDCGRVDGIYGELTSGAVKEFQKSVGIASMVSAALQLLSHLFV
jgi:N-acetylmuramoyl-L-alanine amidase